MKEALYYKKEKGKIRCILCPNNCLIADGKKGQCGIRVNKDGKLYSEIYNRVTSVALDPIEKKPVYHYHSGEYILSLGTKGCNFACPWCQNWKISQDMSTPTDKITSEEVIDKAKETRSFGIAYTYNEPFIWYEFVLECCKKAREAGLKNVFVTNGYINKKPFDEILPYIDAMNIDIKSVDEEFYKKYCLGKLAPVLENVKTAKKKGVHIELTNLIIPTLTDSRINFEKLADWIAENVGPETPLHFSRYYPCYKISFPPTPIFTLQMAKEIADRKLKYVYLGNV
jgi:pyruvate formate lyase activating enzyme